MSFVANVLNKVSAGSFH